MNDIIKVKINVTRISKEYLFAGNNGKYMDLALIPLKAGADQYGNEWTVVQDIPKEARDRGEKGPFIGNAKRLVRRQQTQPASNATLKTATVEDEDCPF
jgi:hypothetical protein